MGNLGLNTNWNCLCRGVGLFCICNECFVTRVNKFKSMYFSHTRSGFQLFLPIPALGKGKKRTAARWPHVNP